VVAVGAQDEDEDVEPVTTAGYEEEDTEPVITAEELLAVLAFDELELVDPVEILDEDEEVDP
jgi:hypothetical protein